MAARTWLSNAAVIAGGRGGASPSPFAPNVYSPIIGVKVIDPSVGCVAVSSNERFMSSSVPMTAAVGSPQDTPTSTPLQAAALPLAVNGGAFGREFITTRSLGKGGFGQVIEAMSQLDGRHYAIKKIMIPRNDLPPFLANGQALPLSKLSQTVAPDSVLQTIFLSRVSTISDEGG